jgi:hypothetical protein
MINLSLLLFRHQKRIQTIHEALDLSCSAFLPEVVLSGEGRSYKAQKRTELKPVHRL